VYYSNETNISQLNNKNRRIYTSRANHPCVCVCVCIDYDDGGSYRRFITVDYRRPDRQENFTVSFFVFLPRCELESVAGRRKPHSVCVMFRRWGRREKREESHSVPWNICIESSSLPRKLPPTENKPIMAFKDGGVVTDSPTKWFLPSLKKERK